MVCQENQNMADCTASPLQRFLRSLAATPGRGDASDGQLLRQFLQAHDEAAFTALLRRHGPLVWGVCRRLLADTPDAEDAFQATFLVLFRKAGAIGRAEALGPWLYGVAYRTALRARAEAARRRARERHVEGRSTVDPALDVVWADLRPVLDEEINRLPARYRRPFVLCYLEGKTNGEAAQLLGCPKGTVLSRLAWARKRLRDRLTRRGIALSAGLFVTLLGARAAPAAVPALLPSATRDAILSLAAGSGTVSASVAGLTKGVLRTMWLTKVKIMALALLPAVVLAGGVATYPARAGRPERTEQTKEEPKDLKKLQGTWEVTDMVNDGTTVPEENRKGLRLVVTKDRMTLGVADDPEARKFRFTLDPDKDPKALDLTSLNGVHKDKTTYGIYELDSDTLKICVPNDPERNERPTAFESKEGTARALITLKRVKDRDKEKKDK
jgi:RNA polymerase sigma factor (sigma-70 family)